jgi:hypothetical protein
VTLGLPSRGTVRLLAKLLEMLREASQGLAEKGELRRVQHEIVARVESRLEPVEAPAFDVRSERLAERLASKECRGGFLTVSLEERSEGDAGEILIEEAVGVGKEELLNLGSQGAGNHVGDSRKRDFQEERRTA